MLIPVILPRNDSRSNNKFSMTTKTLIMIIRPIVLTKKFWIIILRLGLTWGLSINYYNKKMKALLNLFINLDIIFTYNNRAKYLFKYNGLFHCLLFRKMIPVQTINFPMTKQTLIMIFRPIIYALRLQHGDYPSITTTKR